jgi:hypothetical protein
MFYDFYGELDQRSVRPIIYAIGRLQPVQGGTIWLSDYILVTTDNVGRVRLGARLSLLIVLLGSFFCKLHTHP